MTEPLYDDRGVEVPPMDRAQVLRERMNADYPPPWKPKPGESIVGVFARMTAGYAAAYSGHTEILVLADPATGAETSVWLFHTSLVEKLKAARPAIGELVSILFEAPAPGSKAYRYKVDVDRPDGARVDWDAIVTPGKGASVEAPTEQSTGGAVTPAGASTVTPEPPPVQPATGACQRCGIVDGHQDGCPNATSCAECGWVGGLHRPGCAGIPF